MTLRGVAPNLCTSDNCGSGTYLNAMGNCSGKYSKYVCSITFIFSFTACASGCRACTGPNNCLACEDETLYRVTTDQESMVCVEEHWCNDPIVTTFGDRTCGNPGVSIPFVWCFCKCIYIFIS